MVVHDPGGPAFPTAPALPTPDAGTVARDVLAALAERLGDALVEARAQGRVLSSHGPAILDAYDEYRRRAGGAAEAAHFRRALKERCGVELDTARRSRAESGSAGPSSARPGLRDSGAA